MCNHHILAVFDSLIPVCSQQLEIKDDSAERLVTTALKKSLGALKPPRLMLHISSVVDFSAIFDTR